MYELYKDAMPCEGSAIDLLVRARNKAPGEGPAVKSHHIVSQAHNTLVAGERVGGGADRGLCSWERGAGSRAEGRALTPATAAAPL